LFVIPALFVILSEAKDLQLFPRATKLPTVTKKRLPIRRASGAAHESPPLQRWLSGHNRSSAAGTA
jgi:hypothetical protein